MNANGKFGARNSGDRKVWKILKTQNGVTKKTDSERNGKKAFAAAKAEPTLEGKK